jgi:hypothetical protein
MLLARGAVVFCLFFAVQPNLAVSDDASEAVDSLQTKDILDAGFLEVLGSIEAEEDEWFEIFLSTIDEAEEEYITQSDYE